MPRAVYEHSIQDATSATTGSQLETAGRVTAALHVVAAQDPAGGLEVELEASYDGENWAHMYDDAGNEVGTLSGTQFEDPDGDGTYAGHVNVHGLAAPYIRAHISTFAGGTVNVYVGATSNTGGMDYRETGSA